MSYTSELSALKGSLDAGNEAYVTKHFRLVIGAFESLGIADILGQGSDAGGANLTGVGDFTASGTITLNSLVYPSSDGSSGGLLTTDGAGNLSFSSVIQAESLSLASTDPYLDLLETDATTDEGRWRILATNDEFRIQARSDDASLVTNAISVARTGITVTDLYFEASNILLRDLYWPTGDGNPGYVMTTNGAGQLSLTDPDSLSLDHGSLSGLDDSNDHPWAMLAEPSSTDNRLVRWDGTSGRAVQDSAVSLTDNGAMSGLISLNISSTVPLSYLYEVAGGATSPGTDEGMWRWSVDGGTLRLQTRTDADGSGENVLQFQRSATTATNILVGADTLDLQGNDLDLGGGDAIDTGWLQFAASTELTISGGVVTATQTLHTIDTEANASTDDLDTISGGSSGRMLILRAEHTDRTVVLRDNTGNLRLAGDFNLENTNSTITLIALGSLWLELSRSTN